MKLSLTRILTAAFALSLMTGGIASADVTREKDVSYYTHVQVADCTGEEVEFRTRAVTKTTTRLNDDGSSSMDYRITLQSLGHSLSSRTKYAGFESARVVTRSQVDGSSSIRVLITIRYYASRGGKDLKGKTEYYAETDAHDETTVIVDNQSLKCV